MVAISLRNYTRNTKSHSIPNRQGCILQSCVIVVFPDHTHLLFCTLNFPLNWDIVLHFLFSDMSVLDTRVTYREKTQGCQAEGYNAKKNKTFHLESTCFQAISGSLGLFDHVKQSRQSLC